MLSIPWGLSFVVGFLSLSEEILWVRLSGFAYETLPPAFSFVLACYLVGIAGGAVVGKHLCARQQNLYGTAAIVLSVAALLDVLTPVVMGRLIPVYGTEIYIPAVAIIITAAVKSTLFPIVHHLGSRANAPRAGRSMSRIYFGNIMGATLGPVVTGFLALEYLNVDECFGIAAATSLLASIVCVLKSHKPQLIGITLAAAVIASPIASKFVLPGPGSFLGYVAGGANAMSHFVANRHGVIHTSVTRQGEYVFGGNVYDGIVTANVDTNPNLLDRLYIVDLLHPAPNRVLFVGLSTGAWVRAAQGLPAVEQIDVIEINPGYLELIRLYPQVSAILKDPRIHIHIDDGRRWLRRNPNSKYDVIVQNTTYHWRANVTNLLSREYFEESRNHLNPGGVFAANTTGSFDVLATADSVFPYTYVYRNFVYASDHPLTPDPTRLLQVHRPDKKPFSFEGATPTSVAAALATAHLEPVKQFIAERQANPEIITDDNLLCEYKHGRRFGPAFLQALTPPQAQQFTD